MIIGFFAVSVGFNRYSVKLKIINRGSNRQLSSSISNLTKKNWNKFSIRNCANNFLHYEHRVELPILPLRSRWRHSLNNIRRKLNRSSLYRRLGTRNFDKSLRSHHIAIFKLPRKNGSLRTANPKQGITVRRTFYS